MNLDQWVRQRPDVQRYYISQCGPPPPGWPVPPVELTWTPPSSPPPLPMSMPTMPPPAPMPTPAPMPVVMGMPTWSVHRERKRTSHGLHLFLTIITCGLWAIVVWIPITVWHAWGPQRRSSTSHRR